MAGCRSLERARRHCAFISPVQRRGWISQTLSFNYVFRWHNRAAHDKCTCRKPLENRTGRTIVMGGANLPGSLHASRTAGSCAFRLEIDPLLVGVTSVHRLLEQVCARWPIDRIIMFGSRAVGDHEPRSDFDLAISARALSRHQWSILQDFVSESATLFKVAITPLDGMPVKLRKQVLSQGIIIYDVTQGAGQL
jgi:predicted nucleotidyltransferase